MIFYSLLSIPLPWKSTTNMCTGMCDYNIISMSCLNSSPYNLLFSTTLFPLHAHTHTLTYTHTHTHTHIHSYLCDDYVLTDNSAGDISLVQSLLGQVASQSYTASCSRSGCVIRPAQNRFTRSESRMEAANDRAADQRYTALCHWRYVVWCSHVSKW